MSDDARDSDRDEGGRRAGDARTPTSAPPSETEIRGVTEHALPEPPAALPDAENADPETRAALQRRMAEIDLADTTSILNFGAGAQTELQQISQSMLADVKAKDIGPAGDALREMVATIRGFSVSELDTRRERSWWERLIGRAAPLGDLMTRFDSVQAQIDRISDTLLSHEHRLLKDVKALDRMYEKTLAFHDELALYIRAGEERLRVLDETEIPQQRAAAGAAEDTMSAQALRDLRAARDDLERRLHDLRLTRQVTMQALPSIRLVQENDKSLVARINATLVNTVPLWETQLAQALTIERSRQAAQSVRAANDLTNELLTANAENLRRGNRTVREEMERGVVDLEAVRQANDTLIAAINESLEIADAGKTRRKEAQDELDRMEADLRTALSEAKAGAPDGSAGREG